MTAYRVTGLFVKQTLLVSKQPLTELSKCTAPPVTGLTGSTDEITRGSTFTLTIVFYERRATRGGHTQGGSAFTCIIYQDVPIIVYQGIHLYRTPTIVSPCAIKV